MAITSRNRSGFTLVELLVVIAIIAILMGLLIPAVNSIRESSRLMQCRGNLRQIAQACTSYANASQVMPMPGSSGVPGTAQNGGRLADPNARQWQAVGGWLHSILPFLEQQPLYDLGLGLTGSGPTNSLHSALRIKVATAVSSYVCPSRGSPIFSPPSDTANILFINGGDTGLQWRFNPNPAVAARSDYAGCKTTSPGGGALGYNQWSDSARMLEEVVDGFSNVFLCGERYLSPDNYKPTATVNFECNNRGWSVGSEGDVYASATDNGGTALPLLQDTPGVPGCTTCIAYQANAGCWGWSSRFGSPHNGVPMAMLDGSVRVVSFSVPPSLFAQLFNIADGGTADQLQ